MQALPSLVHALARKSSLVQALHWVNSASASACGELHLTLTRDETKAGMNAPCSACLCQDVEGKLESELASGLDACVDEVTEMIAPLGEATAAAVARLQDAEARRSQLAEELEALEKRAAAVE